MTDAEEHSVGAIHHGDGIAGLLSLPRGAASLVITDPPWGCTAAEWDRKLPLDAYWSALEHAVGDSGTVCVFTSFEYGCELRAAARLPFAYDLVWAKNRASGHLNANRSPMRAHELILVFGAAAYTPQKTTGHRPMNLAVRTSRSLLYGTQTETSSNAGTTERYLTSVLNEPVFEDYDTLTSVINAQVVANIGAQRLHPTQKPIPLLRTLVRAYSRLDDLVADPTAGSGSSVRAANLEGRRAIGWEIDPTFASRAAAWVAAPVLA